MQTQFSRPQRRYNFLASSKFFLQNLTPLRFIFLLLGLVLFWLLLGLFRSGLQPELIADAPQLTVQIMHSEAREIPRQLAFYGSLKAFSKVELRVRTEGRVDSLVAHEGKAVKKGDVIAILDMRDYEQKVGEAQSKLKRMQIEYDGAQGAMIEAQLNLASRKIRAPADGVIEHYDVEVGDVLDPMGGKAKLADFVVSGAMSVIISVPEAQINLVEVGQSAWVQTVAGDHYEAAVSFVGTVADAATRSFRVELTLLKQDAKLREGMTAMVSINSGNALAHLVPSSILSLSDAGELGVKVVEKDTIGFYPVKIIQQGATGTEVAGLAAAADIVVQGFAAVLPGEKVRWVLVANPYAKKEDSHAASN